MAAVPAAPAAAGVSAWEDDPRSAHAAPVNRPVPNPLALALKVSFPVPAPAAPGVYPPGTAAFRYWTALDALTRCIAFWLPLLPAGVKWYTGDTLPVKLDAGQQLNAFYDRTALTFFHDTVAGQQIFSGESPDILCHEMGHAVLDSLRPDLFDSYFLECAAFHEAFGDISAMLSAVSLPSFCAAVLDETGGDLGNSSRLSRIAEQLGWAINLGRPDLASPDCLRNAVNAFFYVSPASLSTSGPDATLNAEPHNFSRVFTGGFFDAFAGMVNQTKTPPDTATVQAVALDAARLLIAAVKAAPASSNFYYEVASAMIAADAAAPAPDSGKYSACLRAAFVRRGILPVSSMATVGAPPAAAPAGPGAAAFMVAPGAVPAPATMDLAAQQFGFFEGNLTVTAPSAPALHGLAIAAPAQDGSRSELNRFITYLFQRGRVDLDDSSNAKSGLGHSHSRKTHKVISDGPRMLLKRSCFDCGFD